MTVEFNVATKTQAQGLKKDTEAIVLEQIAQGGKIEELSYCLVVREIVTLVFQNGVLLIFEVVLTRQAEQQTSI